MTDEELKVGLRKGQSQALNEIYRLYFDRTVHWILQNQGTEDEAKDLFQEALMAIYQQLRQPEFTIQHKLGTYLYSVCRNMWLARLRQDRVLRHSQDDALEFVASEEAEDAAHLALEDHLYRSKFLQLGEQCQQILRLFLAGTSVRQITQSLKLSSDSYTKKRKFQCKEQLIKLIQEDPTYKQLQA